MKSYLKILLAILGVIAIFGCVASPAFAYTYAAAQYYGLITISSNTTSSLTDVSANFTANTTAMIAMGLLNATATNCAVVDSAGNYVAFMPGYPGNPWMVFAGNMNPMQTITDTLYTGNNTSGKLAIFGTFDVPVSSTVNATTNATMGMTTYLGATSGDLINKNSAYNLNWNPTTGNVTAKIGGTNNSIITSNSTGTNTTVGIVGVGVSMPSGVVAGGLLISIMDIRSSVTVNITAPSGWTQIFQALGYDISAQSTFASFYRICDGTETTTNFTTNTTCVNAWQCFYIPKENYLGVPVCGITATGNDANPNPPLLTSGFGTVSTMWLAVAGNLANATTVAPAGYTGLLSTTTTGDGVGSAEKYSTAASENPGTFTIAAGTYWAANTIAIQTAVGISVATTQGEHSPAMQISTPFFSLTPSYAGTNFSPVSDSLILNLPLWQTEFNATIFSTIDSNAFSCNKTAPTTWTSTGYTIAPNGFISINTTTSGNFTGDFTLEGWIFPTSANYPIMKSTTSQTFASATTGDWFFLYVADSTISFRVKNGVNAVTTTTAPLNTWSHVAVTRTGTAIKLYINGVDCTSGSPTQAGSIGNSQPIEIGRNEVGLCGNQGGKTGELRVYSASLSIAQILQNKNATSLTYASGLISTYSTLSTIPANSNNITFGNSTLPYILSANITKGGTLVASYAWNYGATLTDLSGNGNTAIFTPRTTSSSPYVSATLSSFLPINQAQASITGLAGGVLPWLAAPAKPNNFTSPTGGIKVPIIGTLMNQLLRTTENQTLFWYIMSFVVIWFGGFLAMRYTHSIVLKAAIMFVLMLGGTLSNVYGFWTIIVFTCYAFGILVMSRHYGF